jgi:CRP/FNR family transcriptional regulator
VEVWIIPAIEFMRIVGQNNLLATAIIRRLSDRILHYIRLVEDLSLRNVETRLANTLLQHAEISEGKLVVPRRQWTTYDEMAIRLGTVRDVLSRSLRTLEVDGFIEVKKHQIVILDPKGLALRGNL